jgi:Flp pilus assembly protein TadG
MCCLEGSDPVSGRCKMKVVRKEKGRGKESEKGQSLVEMALVLPVVLIILAIVLDLGRLYYVTVALTDAAGEGATYAAINPSDTAGVISRAQDASGGFVQVDTGMVTVDAPAITAGAPVTVTVWYNFRVATPLAYIILGEGFDGTVPLRGTATEVILTSQ